MGKHLAEAPLEPDLPIIDSHHHLFDHAQDHSIGSAARNRFLIDEYCEFIDDGHNVIASVFCQTTVKTMQRAYGPKELRPVGEVEFANGQAAMAAGGAYGPCLVAAAIVGFADLSLGDAVRPVLEASIEAAPHRYRGIRDHRLWDEDPTVLGARYNTKPHDYLDDGFRAGFKHLGQLGLTFDAFVLAPQLADVVDLAGRFPDTQIVLNHFGGPVGVGRHKGRMAEEFPAWRAHMEEISRYGNVVVKLGGLGTFLSGSPSYNADPPASSEQLAEEFRPYTETTVELFGADRCMFESNLPTDRTGPFGNVCNAYKRLTAGCSREEREMIFAGTAKRVYRIDLPDDWPTPA